MEAEEANFLAEKFIDGGRVGLSSDVCEVETPGGPGGGGPGGGGKPGGGPKLSVSSYSDDSSSSDEELLNGGGPSVMWKDAEINTTARQKVQLKFLDISGNEKSDVISQL